jgi:hypothetical protein
MTVVQTTKKVTKGKDKELPRSAIKKPKPVIIFRALVQSGRTGSGFNQFKSDSGPNYKMVIALHL